MKICTPNNIDEFLSIFKRFYNSGSCYYRGQADSNWGIIPGLSRNKDKEIYDRIIDIECKLYNKFWRKLCVEKLNYLIPTIENSYHITWQWLMAFQHYGLPTRLIDFSNDKYAALQFSVAELENLDKDGAFFIYINPHSVFEDDKSSILTNPFIGMNKDFFFQTPIYVKKQSNDSFLSERRKALQGSKFFYRNTFNLSRCLCLDADAAHTKNLVKIVIQKEFKLQLIEFLIKQDRFKYDIYKGKNEIDYCAALIKIEFMGLNKENISEYLNN